METTNNQQRACPKDCRMCSFYQQAFCAAQLSFDAVGTLNGLFMEMNELKEKVEAINNLLEKDAEGLVLPSSPKFASSPVGSPTKKGK